MDIHRVGFHWGLPMKLCNLYRKTVNACGHTNTLTSFGGYMRKDIKDNSTTGLSHMKPTIEKESRLELYLHTA